MSEQELTAVKPELKPSELVVNDNGEYSMLMDTARFNQAFRVAKMFADSKLVPAHFQGSTASVFVALHMAMRMNLDPMLVMQNTYLISGRPGMEAKLIIGLVNARGPFKGPIQWELKGEGDSRECTAYAIHKETGERCEATVTWQMVKGEGWASKQGSKWLTIPDMMFRYRSATFLARLYCPEVIMGLSTADELIDMGGEVIEAEPLPPAPEVEKKSRGQKIKEELKTRGKAKTEPSAQGTDFTSSCLVHGNFEGDRCPECEKQVKKAQEGQEGLKKGGPKESTGPKASQAQVDRIKELAKNLGHSLDAICSDYRVASVEELSPADALSLIEWLKTQDNPQA